MKIFERLQLALLRGPRSPEVRARARRWQEADERDPELARDVIVLGRLLAQSPVDGAGRLAVSAEQVAYEAGRRDMALELLAMMRLSPEDLRTMMEMDDA